MQIVLNEQLQCSQNPNRRRRRRPPPTARPTAADRPADRPADRSADRPADRRPPDTPNEDFWGSLSFFGIVKTFFYNVNGLK